MRLISSMSFLSASTSGVCSTMASDSLKRVRMVRRSWLTPFSMVVRCSMARSMRRFISMKAWPAWRTSRAPRGRNSMSRPLPKPFRRLGEAQDRPDLVAQEQDGDAEQDERGAAHPEQEDMRVRRIGLAAPGEHAHDAFVELDPDLDQVRAPDRVDPERPRRPGGAARRRALRRGSRRTASGRAAAGRCRAGCRRRGRGGRRRCAPGSSPSPSCG